MEAMVSTNYEDKQKYTDIYLAIGITKQEIEEAVEVWKKQIYRRRHEFGSFYFMKLFKIYPEIITSFAKLKKASEENLKAECNEVG